MHIRRSWRAYLFARCTLLFSVQSRASEVRMLQIKLVWRQKKRASLNINWCEELKPGSVS